MFSMLHADFATALEWAPATADPEAACAQGVMSQAERVVAGAVAAATEEAFRAALPGRPVEEVLHAQARIRSCASFPSGAWLTALPVTPDLTMTDYEFWTGGRLRLGLPALPSAAVDAPCPCGRPVSPADLDHAMCCDKLHGFHIARHDRVIYAWRRLARRATAASSREPTLRLLRGRRDPAFRSPRTAPQPGEPTPPAVSVSLQPVGGTVRVRFSVSAVGPEADLAAALAALPPDKRGDIALVTDTMRVCDVVVTHPCIREFLQGAAERDGFAAAERERRKVLDYQGGTGGFDFVPLGHETYGRLGRPAAALVNELAGLAAASGAVEKSAFVVAAYRELSVALVKGNAAVFAQMAFNWARTAGGSFWPGDAQPSCSG